MTPRQLTLKGWALIGTCLFYPMSALADELSFADAQQQAITFSRQLAAQDDAIASSRDMAIAAGQRPDPTLKLGIDNLPVTQPDRYSIGRDFMTMRRIGVMQELTRSNKLALRSERYRDQAELAEAEKMQALTVVTRETAKAWLQRYYLEAMSHLVDQQAEQTEQSMAAAESSYRGGKSSQGEVLAARTALLMLDDQRSDLDRQVRTAKTTLARWVGPELASRTLSGKPDIDHIHFAADTLAAHLARHPDLIILDKRVEVARTEAKLAAANKQADWTVDVSYAERGPDYSNMVSVGVSVPLQWNPGQRQDREAAAKQALLAGADAEREDMQRAHTSEVQNLCDEWQTDRDRLSRYRTQILPVAHARVSALLASYRGGKSTLAEVLDARRNELAIQLQSLQLEMDTARIWADLNFLIPESDPDVPGSATPVLAGSPS